MGWRKELHERELARINQPHDRDEWCERAQVAERKLAEAIAERERRIEQALVRAEYAERQRDKLAEAIRRHRAWIDRRTRQADIELYVALSTEEVS